MTSSVLSSLLLSVAVAISRGSASSNAHPVAASRWGPTAKPAQEHAKLSNEKQELIDGTKEMVALLASISKQVNGDSGLYGTPSLEVIRFLRQLEEDHKPAVRAGLQVQLGKAYLRSGEIDLGLQQFELISQFLGRITAPHYAQVTLADAIATGYLRKAERDNCLALHSPDSCLMPLQGGGVHQNTAAAKQAELALLQCLKLEPENRGSKWLLNLVHMALGSYPDGVPSEFQIPASVFQSETPMKRFINVATKLGIDVLGMAGSVVLEDMDNDGLVDILVSAWGLEEQLIYLHNSADGTFEDRTKISGLTGICGGLNMSHADYDNDGDADILVLRGAWKTYKLGHPNSLLRNNGDGTFSDITQSAGIFSRHPTQVGQWADFDNDGWLDIFIGNESVDGSIHPCELYHNNHDGTFSNRADELGLAIQGFVKGATWGDYDNDGDMDLYVSRLGEPNQLFENRGVGTEQQFVDVAAQLGVDAPTRSFPTWFFDYDNDGLLDLFVAPFPGFNEDSLEGIARDYLGESHDLSTAKLYRGLADGGFADVSKSMGLDDPMLAMGGNFGDIDNDGYLDIYIGTGEPTLHTLVPNRMYRNNAAAGFQNVTFSGGFGHLQKGHGIAFGDLDNDGDQDVYGVMGGAYIGDTAYNACFLNPGSKHGWVNLHVQGTKSNRSAIGARLRIQLTTPNGPRLVFRTVSTGGSFGSSTLAQEIGLGNATAIESVDVRWPGKTTFSNVSGVAMNGFYRITEGLLRAAPLIRKPIDLQQ